MKRHWTLNIGLWTLLGLWTLDVSGATYYVSKTASGPDRNASTNCSTTDSNATNKLTIRWGMSCLTAGDTLYIHTGTYAEAITPTQFTIPIGTAASPITISAFTGESVILSGYINIQDNVNASVVQYLIFNRLIVDTGGSAATIVETQSPLSLQGNTHHITVQNCELRNANTNIVTTSETVHDISILNNNIHHAFVSLFSGTHPTTGNYGMYVKFNSSVISGNTFHDLTGYAVNMYAYGFNNKVNNNVIKNNTIYTTGTNDGERAGGGSGILVASGDNALIYNNILYSNIDASGGTACITVYGDWPATNAKVYNNTIYGNQGIAINVRSGATNAIVRNNIVYNNTGGQIVNSGTGTTFSNNLGGSPGVGIAVVGNPLFVNTASNDFHLQSGSPAKDAGVTIAAVTTDFDGFARPQPPNGSYDIGAYEFLSAIPPPLSTISMTFPNGGENLMTGTPVNITWASNDTHIVKLEVSRDGGTTYPETIVTGITQTADANNSYTWTPTPPRSLTTKIRVTNLFDLVADESNATCNLRGFYVK